MPANRKPTQTVAEVRTDRYGTTDDTLVRYLEVAAEVGATILDERDRIEDPEQAVAILSRLAEGSPQEIATVLTLDTKHRPLAVRLASVGSVDHTFMTPREIFRGAIADNAAAVMLHHHHPSGDPTPSRDDESITRRNTEAGRLIGVEVLDHIITATGGAWTSMARLGHV